MVTAISTGTYTNTLTVLVPATTINLGATLSLTGLAAGDLIGADEATLDRVYEEAGSRAAHTLRASLDDPDLLCVAEVVQGDGS